MTRLLPVVILIFMPMFVLASSRAMINRGISFPLGSDPNTNIGMKSNIVIGNKRAMDRFSLLNWFNPRVP